MQKPMFMILFSIFFFEINKSDKKFEVCYNKNKKIK